MRLAAITSVFAIALTLTGCSDDAKTDGDGREEGPTELSAEEFCGELTALEDASSFKKYQKEVAAIVETGVSRDVPSEVRTGFGLWSEMAQVAWKQKAISFLEKDVTELEGLQLEAYHDWVEKNC